MADGLHMYICMADGLHMYIVYAHVVEVYIMYVHLLLYAKLLTQAVCVPLRQTLPMGTLKIQMTRQYLGCP